MFYDLTEPITPETRNLTLGFLLVQTMVKSIFWHEGRSMKKNLFLLLLLSISTFLFCGTSQAQLVTNGTFDSNASGWSWENIDGAGGWRSAGGNPDGNFILNSNGSTTDPTISQLVTGLTPSAQYTLSGDFASVYSTYGSPSALSFGIFADGTLIASYARPGGEDVYGSFSVDISATDSDILLAFKGEMDGDDSSYRIDNISLILSDDPPPPVAVEYTPVPINSAWALIILTVSLILFGGLIIRREQ